MKKVLKIGAAGAFAFAGVAAHASISQPSTGSSDAILFAEVVNAAGTKAVASFAGDTGVSISTLEGGGGQGTYLGGNSNLAALFAADTTANCGGTCNVYFAVLGGQYTGNANAPNFKTPGIAQFITTVLNNDTTTLAGDTTGSLTHFAGINGDISTINTNSGGASSVEGASPASAGVWDVINTSGTAYWDGGGTPNANTMGTTANLYYVTAGTPAGTTTPVAFAQKDVVTLSANGVTISAVPIPAAVWLLASGLLGFAGVARRKLSA
jgi:hypothetical protein